MSGRSIALFTEYFFPHVGGIEMHVIALAHQLQRDGMQVTVLTPYPGPDVVDGIPVRRFDVPLLPGLNTVYTPLGAMTLYDELRSGRYDFLHCHHSVYSPATGCAAYLGTRAHLPTVLTFHSVIDGYTTGFRLLNHLTRFAKRPITFTAVSNRVADSLRKVIGEGVLLLPNAVDASQWQVEHRPSDREFRIVSTMRLVRRKRPRALIEMLALVRERLPADMTLRARIIGDGVERNVVERVAAELALDDVVQLCGRLTHEQIREVYAESDAFVLPTIEESFGIAALEARSAGLPVVAMKNSGVATFIEHGREGLLASNDTEMTAYLIRLARDPELRAKIAHHNRAQPSAFQWPALAAQHTALYESLV